MPRRKHENRRASPFAQSGAHRHTGHVGQSEVEDDELRPLSGGKIQSASAVLCLDDARRRPLQRRPHDAPNLRLVVDDEHSERRGGCRCGGRLGGWHGLIRDS